MAKSAVSTSDELRKLAWEEKLYRDSVFETYFQKFMGKGSDSIVHVKENFTKEQGDKITFGLRNKLSGAGKTSGQTLEGYEEALSTYDFNVELEEYAHAVRDRGPLDRQRPIYDMDEESRSALKDWMTEKRDGLCFDAIFDTPTRVAYRDQAAGAFKVTATPGTAQAALSATNSLLTPNFINQIKTYAKTGGNRDFIPIRPIKWKGRDYYVLLAHEDVLTDLKTNTNWQQAQREAQERGKDNPLFQTAEAIYDNVLIHAHERCPIATDGGGASVAWGKCVLMGAQALAWAEGMRPKLVAEEFDYGREHGFAISTICGVEKAKFNSEDYGSLGVYLARTQLSDTALV